MFAGRSATAGSDEPESSPDSDPAATTPPESTPESAPESSVVLPVDDGATWTRAVAVGLGAYLISRLCVIAATAVRASQVVVDARADGEPEPGAGSLISGVLTSWDGRWYLELVRRGYPDSIPANITYEQLEARAAFFPLYPWIVRLADAVLPGGDTIAALSVNFVLGAISVVLVGLLARRLYSVGVAARAMTLYAVFPGSAILSFAYSEALLIVLAAACLLLLLDERWLLAGVAAA
ncbi:MAG TPA: hypothetical protein VLN74_01650, partial [Ilumatobacteraceae bacterium]|nr:hypothetical protein [Ilumatobacteraceae bacterium]